MKVYFAADHAGFELKQILVAFVRDELRYEVEDCGAHGLDPSDDYPGIIASAARKVAADARAGIQARGIILGGSGQGEAMVANRFKHVRAAVYYGGTHSQYDASGKELDMIASVREHNDANTLSLGARFIGVNDAKQAVQRFLSTPCSGEDRHMRRVRDIDNLAA